MAAKQTGCAPKARDVLKILCIIAFLLLTMSCTEPQFDNQFDGIAKSYLSSSEEQSSSSSEELSSSFSSSSYAVGLSCENLQSSGKVGEPIQKPRVWCNGVVLEDGAITWGGFSDWNNPTSAQNYEIKATVANGGICDGKSFTCGNLTVEKGDGAEVVGFNVDEKYKITSKSVKVTYLSLNPSTGQDVEYCNKTDKDCVKDEDWQLDSLFEGLSFGRGYEIIARAKENYNYKAGNITEPISVSTLSVSCNVAGTANITSSSSTEIYPPGTVMCGEKKVDTEEIKWNGINLEDPAAGEYDNIQAKITDGDCKDETVTCTGTFKVKYLCDEEDYDPETSFCHESEGILSKCGGEEYNPTTEFCYEDNKGSFCGNNPQKYNPNLYKCDANINANAIYLKNDVSDGTNNYKAVLIGTQTWMAKNLNYATSSGSKCYNNCDKYGSLYDWATAMNGSRASSSKPSSVQGICPVGWHLPSNAEWEELVDYVENEQCSNDKNCAGLHLKATSDWNEYEGVSGNGTDDYGFVALPGGYYYNIELKNTGNNGYWWSTNESGDTYAYHRYVFSGNNNASATTFVKANFLSVRCLQD